MKYKKIGIFWIALALITATVWAVVDCTKDQPEKNESQIEIDSSLLIINDNIVIE